MNAIEQHRERMPVATDNAGLINVLRNSLYPNAEVESVEMVLAYCRAAGLDPMQKPVHIVPMWNTAAGRLVDQVMPGIGLYRIQASRTGQYAGVSEPEFGPDVIENIGGTEITYPAWCKVVVRRLLPCGQVCEFAAIERWKENYATKKSSVTTPNAMWARRPYAQLAKCAEAQALRKAFPEVGSQPTADEMEGKEMDVPRDVMPSREPANTQLEQPSLPHYPDDKFSAALPDWQARMDAGKTNARHLIAMVSSRYTLSEQQIEKIYSLEAITGEQA